MIRQYIWFDDWIKCRSGKRKPFWQSTTLERIVEDQELIWFHECYGMMNLYRMHKVDDENFIAEDLKVCCSTSSRLWDSWSENPELAIAFFN